MGGLFSKMGGAIGGMFSGGGGSAKMSNPFESFGDSLGMGSKDQSNISALGHQRDDVRQSQYDYANSTADKMAQNDATNLEQMRGNVGKAKDQYGAYTDSYQKDQAALKQEADAARTNSQNTYSNTIEPRMKGIMEGASKEAGTAMTLKDSMDPNNSVHKAVEKKYEDQAQGEGRAGMADVGVMQGLGAQNLSMQLGDTPMTGGQMSALMGQNMSQAGTAMANVQKRQQNLRDQGLERGFDESDKAYGRGQDAKGVYAKSVGDYESAGSRNDTRQANFRNESGGYQKNISQAGIDQANYNFGKDTGLSSMQHDYSNQDQTRRLANNQQMTSGQIEDINGAQKSARASQEAKRQRLNGMMGMAGGAMGGMGGLGKMMGGLFGGGSGGSGGSSGAGDQSNFDEGNHDESGNMVEADNEGTYGGADGPGPVSQQQSGSNSSVNYSPVDQQPSEAQNPPGAGQYLTDPSGYGGGYSARNPYYAQNSRGARR